MASTGKVQNKDFSIELNSFRTINTKDSPVTMKDDELPILINFMPIGTSLNVVPGYSAVLATIGNSETAWPVNTAVTKDVTVIRPTVPNGFIYVCSKTGTTDAATEPTWTTTGTQTDGTAEWLPYSCDVIRWADINLGGVIHKLVVTKGGALYDLDASWVQTRCNIPSVNPFTDPQFEQWKYTTGLIIDPTAGYYSYTGGGSAGMTHRTLLSAPTKGTAIAIWKGSVFISDGRTIYGSAPDSFTDFQLASGGFNQVDVFSSLRNQINALVAAQDYLYIVGDHATHIATAVQTYTGTGTVLTLIDAVPGVGTPYPDTVRVLGPDIVEYGNTGINAVSGSNYSLLSSMLDGVLSKVDTSFKPVGWFAKIFNKQVYCVLVKAPHPVDGTLQKFIFCYYEERWFYVLYGQDFLFAGQSATATDTKTYAAYGNNIVEIFTGESSITKKFRMKAMNFGSPILDKQILWLGATIISTSASGLQIAVTLSSIGSGNPTESANGSTVVTFSTVANSVIWLNNNGVEATWDIPFGLVVYADILGMAQCDGRGKRIQIDYEETSSEVYTISGIMVGGQYVAER